MNIETDWIKKSCEPNLSIEFLRENKDNLMWRCVQKNTKLTKEMLNEFQDYIDWHLFFIMQPYNRDYDEF